MGSGSEADDWGVLQDTCVRKLREETAKYPQFQDWDNDSSVGGSTRPVSGVNTPLNGPNGAAGGGGGGMMKLKLTLTGAALSRGGTESAAQSDDD